MDLVAEDARSLQRELGAGDRVRLDAYFTSVRDLERRLKESEAWAGRPKPKSRREETDRHTATPTISSAASD